MAGNSEKLTPKQQVAIGALLTNSTIALAAVASRTSERTLFRWLNLDHFNAAFAATRQQIVNQALSRTQGAMSKAIDTLLVVMEDPEAPVSTKVSSAKIILNIGTRAREIADIETRLADIEKQIGLVGRGGRF